MSTYHAEFTDCEIPNCVIEQSQSIIHGCHFTAKADDVCSAVIPHGIHSVTFEDCIFDGFEATKNQVPKAAILVNAGPDNQPIGFRGPGNITVRNCLFRNWSDSIHFNDATGLTVEGCRFENAIGTESSYGYGINASGADIFILNNKFISGGRHAVYLSFCVNAKVTGNYITDYQSSGIALNNNAATNLNILIAQNQLDYCCQTSTYHDDAAIGCYVGGENLSIIDNLVRRSGRHALYAKNYKGLTIRGNAFKGFALSRDDQHGLLIESCHGRVQDNDIIGDTAGVQFEAVSSDLIVSGNYFSGRCRANLRNNGTIPRSNLKINNNYGLAVYENPK